jgi:hypothetical protein
MPRRRRFRAVKNFSCDGSFYSLALRDDPALRYHFRHTILVTPRLFPKESVMQVRKLSVLMLVLLCLMSLLVPQGDDQADEARPSVTSVLDIDAVRPPLLIGFPTS